MTRYTLKHKRSKKSKNKKTRRKKAGFLKHLTDDIVRLWENPHEERTPNDCCPCVFSLLGMPKDTVDYLREHNQNGFSKDEIEDGFNLAYPKYHFRFQKSDNIMQSGPDIFRAYLLSLWDTIPKNYATIGGYERNDGTKHCIVLAKNNDNSSIILDAQTSLGYHGISNISTHLLSQSVKFMYHLVSQKKGQETNQPLIFNPEGNIIMSANEEKSVVDELSSGVSKISLEDSVAMDIDDE
tara:strand:- start:5295 stop:6011 length:717 start_codon:yes stop_codon:yes gene_type:complete